MSKVCLICGISSDYSGVTRYLKSCRELFRVKVVLDTTLLGELSAGRSPKPKASKVAVVTLAPIIRAPILTQLWIFNIR